MSRHAVALMCVGLAAAAPGLTADNATGSFKRLLGERYGHVWTGASVSWARCPHEEYIETGDGAPAAFCMAEFRAGRTWHYVSATVERGPVLGDRPYTRTWTRRWRELPATCLRHVRGAGRAWSNDGTCPALMISDLASTVRMGGTPRRAYWHGTDTAGFEAVASYRCTTRGRTITCTNRLGDAFRWTPRQPPVASGLSRLERRNVHASSDADTPG